VRYRLREKPSTFHEVFSASLVIFLGRASPARKILVRTDIIAGKINPFLSVRTRIFRAREARLEKITSEEKKGEAFFLIQYNNLVVNYEYMIIVHLIFDYY